MSSESASGHHERVLLVAPTRRDAQVTCDALSSAGVTCTAFETLQEVASELARGVGALMLTDRALFASDLDLLLIALDAQEAWSNVPIVLMCRERDRSPAVMRAIEGMRNVTLLDRPASMRSMVSTVQAALRGRRWQYQIRDQMRAQALAAEVLRANELRQSFLVTLVDTIRSISDPVAVQTAASRLLGERLGASRVAYFEVRGGDYWIEQDYAAEVKSVVGRHAIADFGERLTALFQSGSTSSCSDVGADLALCTNERAAFAALDIAAYVGVPLIKGGEWVAGLAVHSKAARAWTATEIALVEDTAERTWAAVERARIETALSQSEERAAFVRRASGVGFWYCDLPFDVLQWDDLVKGHFHLPPDAAVTIQTFYERLHPEDREPTRRAIEESIARRTSYDVDYRTVHPHTLAITWVRAIGRTFYAADGQPIRFDGLTLDVSDKKRAEASLRQSEERRRLALDAAELGAWHIDPTTDTLTSDDRCRQIFTGSIDAITKEQAFAAIHPDDRDRIRAAVEAATRPERRVPYAEEYRVIHKDGAVRWVFAKGLANYDLKHTPHLLSFDGTVADITERKLIEDEREQLVAQLREQDRRKDEFLATLAHELRNPLAPLRNGLHLIRRAKSPETVEQARAMMERQLRQMTRLVDDLLDVSRVTTGKLRLQPERLELRSVIVAALETSRPLIEQEAHRVSVVVPDEPLVVHGDPIRLAQVVSNLLNNAAKYTPRGGHIRVTARREGEFAALAVSDDGIGIPGNMLDAVFEMFGQVDRTLEKTTGGLGIGLSLVKRLVEIHGGTIEARSEGQGRGSEFVARLPVAAPALPTALKNAAASRSVTPAGPCRILVVDDNMDAADSLGQFLAMMGNDVRTVYDGEAGVEAAGAFRPCVVLCDIGMPKLNGYDAARRIRAQSWGKDMVLVALTGWSQQDDVQRSAEAGFDHHLVKPVEADALIKLIAAWQPTAA